MLVLPCGSHALIECWPTWNLNVDMSVTNVMQTDSAVMRWLSRYRFVVLAIVGSLLFHGVLLLAGSYRGTYDAYVHIFFGDHYRRAWWSLWEPRWYTGFTMVSYPPLTHQLIALVARVASLPFGFIMVMIASTMLTSLGVYRFSRLWVDERPAQYAALLTVVSSSITETVHVFGQLPTMFVIGVMLNALPFMWAFIERGRWRDLFRSWALLMVAAAGHHVTTLFGMVFFSGPIIATLLVKKFRTPRRGEQGKPDGHFQMRNLLRDVLRRSKRVSPAFVRSGVFGVGLILILVITVLPYWLWSRSDPITQISIPHASRDSFLENTAAGLVFFLIPWGVISVALPYAIYKGFGTRNWILASSLVAMAFLGTGGTTPLPAFLLRGAFYILTLDRFTFWATVIILPFAGQFLESLLHGRLGAWIIAHVGSLWRDFGVMSLTFALAVMALFTANLTQFRRFQPAPIDMTPIVEFLAKDNHDHWRYLTLGFGDQMAWLSAQTTALDVEGNYHSARRLPEMTSTPIERLDGAKFTGIPGLGSLEQFLTTPQRFNLKWVFVNDAFYEPLLYFTGWNRLVRLDNDIVVWERQDVPPLPAAIPEQPYPDWQRLMWGVLPVGSIFVATMTFLLTGLVAPRLPSFGRLPVVRRILRWRWVQGWLVEQPGGDAAPPSEDWQYWKRILRRVFPGMRLTPLARRMLWGTLLFVIVLAGAVGAVLVLRQANDSPEAAILAYYDALDFKRFSEAYTYLATDLTLDEYLRWLSLQGGIVASFAKLDNLYTTLDWQGTSHVLAGVTAEWVTSLGTYSRIQQHEMVHAEQGWRIVLDVVPPPRPLETFSSGTEAAWAQTLPLSTLDETALTRGVLDRSLLSAGPARLVYRPDVLISFEPTGPPEEGREGRFRGLVSVVGLVTNADTYPAHVTITGILRDAAGNRLAENNVADVMLHQLLPGETTPYRLDFFGAQAAEIPDISAVASVELSIRGIPTPYNLSRSLVLLDENTLYNAGTALVDIPHVLANFYEEELLTWVEGIYLESALSPGRTLEFVPPTRPADLTVLEAPILIDGPRLAPWSPPADFARVSPYVLHGYSQ